MGVTDVLSRKSGVIVQEDVKKLFDYAQAHNFAIPAIVNLAWLSKRLHLLINSECHLLVHGGCVPRSCPR